MKEGIVGHEKVIERLEKLAQENNLSHSYLFQGLEGLGKKTIAVEFAKLILCEKKANAPCGSCSSCVKMETNNHPDFQIIEAEKNIISKEKIDRIVEAGNTAPFQSERKIFIIDNAHLMNKESMNGLLKTLEEPAEFLNIILITHKLEGLLPTIISRCEGIKFSPIEREILEDYIRKNYKILENEAKFIVEISQGSIARAINFLQREDLLELREEIISIISSLLDGNKALISSSSQLFESKKEDIDFILDIFTYFFRDLALYKEVKSSDLIINKDKLELFKKYTYIDFSYIDGIIENIEATRINIKNNINFILGIETMLLKIQGVKDGKYSRYKI